MTPSSFAPPPPTSGAQFTQRERTIVPAGTRHAVCSGVAYAGHYMESFKGEEPKKLQIVYLFFEFPKLPHVEIYDKNGGTGIFRPLQLSKKFTYSFDKKANLRKFIETFYGQTFTDEQAAKIQLHKLVGRNGIANITHDVKGENVYEVINSVSPLMEEMQVINLEHDPILFSFNADSYGGDKDAQKNQFEKLPPFIKKAFKNSIEFMSGNLSHLESAQPSPAAPQPDTVVAVVGLSKSQVAAADAHVAKSIAAAKSTPQPQKTAAPVAPPQVPQVDNDDLPF